MIAVILDYPNGRQEQVLLAGVPRVGERINLANGREEPPLIATSVIWMQGCKGKEPTVIVTVRRSDTPR